MSFTKEEALKIIDNMSETDDWEDMMYKIYVRESIENGLEDINNGRVLNEEQVKKRLNKWLI